VGSRTTYRLINNNWARAWLHKRPKGTSEESLVLFGCATHPTHPTPCVPTALLTSASYTGSAKHITAVRD
jgi:hypothetical protein